MLNDALSPICFIQFKFHKRSQRRAQKSTSQKRGALPIAI